MKIYRIKPKEAGKPTIFFWLGLAFVAALVPVFCIMSNLPYPEIESEIETANQLWAIIVGAPAFAALYGSMWAFGKNKKEKGKRLEDVYINNDDGKWYYITLNNRAFEAEKTFNKYMNSENERVAEAGWKAYHEFMQREDLAKFLPAILEGKLVHTAYQAVIAVRIKETENFVTDKGCVRFTFYADGSNKAWNGAVYDYMNDHEELLEGMKALSKSSV